MQHSSVRGSQSLVSNRLTEYLDAGLDEPINIQDDEFDRLITVQKLRINRFVFFRDLDLVLFILSNRRILNCRLSDYPFMASASDEN